MTLAVVLFYLFSFIAVVAGLMVISLKNPVHSVLSLIVAFFSAAWLFIMLGAEFISMLLIIVYAGAVAVLFLFVIMMMDINFAELKQGFLKYLPVGAVVAIVLFVELFVVFQLSDFNPRKHEAATVAVEAVESVATNVATNVDGDTAENANADTESVEVPVAANASPEQNISTNNTLDLGKILYTNYFLAFQVSGLILLVAMIGAIVLTLRHKEGVRRQKISRQVSRTVEESMKIVKVEQGKGI